jgi:hypothetical protein
MKKLLKKNTGPLHPLGPGLPVSEIESDQMGYSQIIKLDDGLYFLNIIRENREVIEKRKVSQEYALETISEGERRRKEKMKLFTSRI